MKRFLTLAIAAAMLVGACLAFVSCGDEKTNYAKDNTEFYFGASGPLTGGAAVYGTAVKNAATMAVEEINAAGGINGVKIKFVMMDDKHDPSLVSTNYTKMLEEGMQVSLGCVTTGPCKEWKALSKDDNLFYITPSASADTIVEFDNAAFFTDRTTRIPPVYTTSSRRLFPRPRPWSRRASPATRSHPSPLRSRR